ncbi:MAG: energy transducer TonB [Terriglobales bacterium]
MPLLEEKQVTDLTTPVGDDSEQKQRRQMLVALALLLAALILVLIKDRDFWFPPEPVAQVQSESEPVEEPASDVKTPSETATAATTPTPVPARPKSKPHTPQPAATDPGPAPALAPVVMSRAVLPPLEVEVVAGDEHRTIPASTGSVRVDLQPRAPFSSTPAPASSASSASASTDSTGVADATGRVHLSPGAAQILSRPVEPNYPLLAKQMKVQGAVVLEALIGRDGNIQDLHVLSGPTILSTAAREAVKQWRFRPYLQSGQAVETEARITVNFTISTQ